MNSHQTILQSRIQELQARRDRLTQKLQALSQQRDYETRAEEKLRMDAIINETESDRRQVEEELIKLEDELAAFSAPLVSSEPASVTTPTTPRPRSRGPITLFYSYSHKDEALRERLEPKIFHFW
jgi:predicted  nucleic acid-binding Zn-ribbon protein